MRCKSIDEFIFYRLQKELGYLLHHYEDMIAFVKVLCFRYTNSVNMLSKRGPHLCYSIIVSMRDPGQMVICVCVL